jgi:hypothetical protein
MNRTLRPNCITFPHAAYRVDLFKLEDDQTKAKFSVVVFDCFELLNVSRAVSALYNYSEDF